MIKPGDTVEIRKTPLMASLGHCGRKPIVKKVYPSLSDKVQTTLLLEDDRGYFVVSSEHVRKTTKDSTPKVTARCPRCGFNSRREQNSDHLYWCEQCRLVFDDDPGEGGDYGIRPDWRMKYQERGVKQKVAGMDRSEFHKVVKHARNQKKLRIRKKKKGR